METTGRDCFGGSRVGRTLTPACFAPLRWIEEGLLITWLPWGRQEEEHRNPQCEQLLP